MNLPYEALEWKDFERLCLRLASQLEGDINGCRFYGEQGNAQDGIDLYVKNPEHQKYKVFQCKRVKDFTGFKIKAAINEFLKEPPSEWELATEEFVLCTSESLNKSDRDKAFREQEKRLREKNITLRRWDADELDRLLKVQPQIVDDFFGREWVRRFCGEDALLGLKDRLDVQGIHELQNQLKAFYQTFFKIQDAGQILMATEAEWPAFQDRFVPMDVWVERNITPPRSSDRLTAKPDPTTENALSSNDKPQEYLSYARQVQDERRDVSSWLTLGRRSIILGGPGSGKSTLLRFLSLDLLSEQPHHPELIRHWQGKLPLYLPFSVLLKMKEEQSHGSIVNLLQLWLRSHHQEHLIPLLNQAFNNNQLLLLVDGLDEHSNESHARHVLDQVMLFVEEKNLPVVMSCRPHSWGRFKTVNVGGQVARLAPLNESQQRKLADIWFWHLWHDSRGDVPSQKSAIASVIDAFFVQIKQQSAIYARMVEVPLLLCLLITLQKARVNLPPNRHDVYRAVVDLLLDIHPKKRQQMTAAPFPVALHPEDLKNAFAALAYTLHANDQDNLNKHESRKCLARHLQDGEYGLAYSAEKAGQVARELLDFGLHTLSVLVEPAPDQVGFFHRSIQEFLAAQKVLRQDQGEKVQWVQQHALLPEWREVVLGVLSQTQSVKDINLMIDAIKNLKVDALQKHYREVLLAELAFSNSNLPAGLAQELASGFLERIERENYGPHQLQLLKLALGGLDSQRVAQLVEEKVTRWFPQKVLYPTGLLSAISTWPYETATADLLTSMLKEQDDHVRHKVAQVLGQYARGDQQMLQHLKHLARCSTSKHQQLGSLEALVLGWPDLEDLNEILEFHQNSPEQLARLLAYQGLADRRPLTSDELEELLNMLAPRNKISFTYQRTLIQTLSKGAAGNPAFIDLLLSPPKSKSFISEFSNKNIVLQVMVLGFPEDPRVPEKFFQTSGLHLDLYWDSEVPEFLCDKYRNHPTWQHEAARFLAQHQFEDDWNRFTIAACLSPTPEAKQKILQSLPKLPYRKADALLKAWGMEDPETRSALTEMVYGDNKKAIQLHDLIPQILQNEHETYQRVKELAISSNIIFVEPLSALLKLQNLSGDPELFELCLRDAFSSSAARQILFKFYSDQPEVQELIEKVLDGKHNGINDLARSMGADATMRARIRNLCMVLPADARTLIAEELRHVGTHRQAIGWLSRTEEESNTSTLVQSAIHWVERSKMTGDDLQDLKEKFRQYLEEGWAQSPNTYLMGVSGLLTMGEEKALVAYCRWKGVTFTDLLTSPLSATKTPQLYRQITEHYAHLSEHFPTDFAISNLASNQALFTALCSNVQPENPLAGDLIRTIAQQPHLQRDPEVLDFLSTSSQINMFKDVCLKAIKDPYWAYFDRAVEHLEEKFIGEPEVIKYVQDNLSFSLDPEEIHLQSRFMEALLAVDPDTHLKDQIQRWAASLKEPYNLNLDIRLKALTATPEELLEQWRTLTLWVYDNPNFLTEINTMPILNRLKGDVGVATLWNAALNTDNHLIRQTVPLRFLSATGKLSVENQDMFLQLLEQFHDEMVPCPLVVDWLAKAIRPLRSVLLDALP